MKTIPRATPIALTADERRELDALVGSRKSEARMREQLGIELAPLDDDPLDLAPDQRSWEPWPPKLAQVSFLHELQALAADQSSATAGAWPAEGR